MSEREQKPPEPVRLDAPSSWDWEVVEDHLCERIRAHRLQGDVQLAPKRVRLQLGEDPGFRDLARRWAEMDEAARAGAWQGLVDVAARATEEMLPICAACGSCCRTASPTLHEDDLELLRGQSIPPSSLMTLRKGEPVLTPLMQRPLFLTEERIKVREKPGTTECLFLDGEADRCTIYDDRPLQCRAQACWDESLARELIREKPLTRYQVFRGVDPLIEVMDEHDRRCSFAALSQAFQELEESAGGEAAAVIDALAFEEHFRRSIAAQLALPEDTLELVFGRPFSRLIRLFGYRVDTDPDGTRTLVPEATPRDA